MKILSGSELVEFIKERQAKQVRALKQAEKVLPHFAIVRSNPGSRVIDTYIRLKKTYGADIGVEVSVYEETSETLEQRIISLNEDEQIHGIIVQLPIVDETDVESLLSAVAAKKDVDGLGSREFFDPATPMAILWLLAGYNISMDTPVAIVGNGRLVGSPLAQMLKDSGVEVTVFEKDDGQDLARELPSYDTVITATGQAGLITSEMLKPGAVVVDAGTSSENGVIKGDVSDAVRERQDLTITPIRGGVGPLTVAALFDNVIRSARRQAETTKKII